ncbi:MAG TPA: 2'-5' RNA ligase family protein [Candidatus Saccharimonadales bacterium]|nr:2'-5' RNA ligase family protein [Candidatus Saccharimonadales bacterium]
MSRQRNEHLVVIMLEHVPTGQEFEIWNRHITIVPWLPCDDKERLDKVLEQVATRHKSFTVKAGKVETWGRKEKYEIQKIDDPGDLHQLHWDVFRSLEKNGFSVHQKDYLGEKYTPHVALRNRLQKGSALKRGQQIAVNKFTLVRQVRLKGSGRMIKSLVKDYELHG